MRGEEDSRYLTLGAAITWGVLILGKFPQGEFFRSVSSESEIRQLTDSRATSRVMREDLLVTTCSRYSDDNVSILGYSLSFASKKPLYTDTFPDEMRKQVLCRDCGDKSTCDL